MDARAETATATIMHWWRPAMGILALALLGLFLYLDREHRVLDAMPLRHHPPTPTVAFLLLGTVCFPLGVPLLLMALRDGWLAAKSPSWPTVAGTVLQSEVETRVTKGPRNYLDVRYEYPVDGRHYEGSRVFFSQNPYRFRGNAEKVVARFPVGSRPAVHYDPDDPGIAVLDTTATQVWSSVWSALVMLLVPFLSFSQAFRDFISS